MNFDVILLVLQVFLAIAIIGLILLQKGKGASEGATFGGGGAGTVFGASGSSNFLSKSTAILATCFFLNSLALAYLAGHRDAATSVIDTIEVTTESGVEADQVTESFGGSIPLPTDAQVESDVPAPADAVVESDVPPPAE
ncbi:MAG: preprotein translocase subunit SecG [Gammaproteobacteria bacterium]|nr:preprotein translocase subunit SecG [Gammaproteobacteria bacterium]